MFRWFLDSTDPQATALFIEYAAATHGRQAHRYSAHLRRNLGLTTEKTDDELNADDENVGIELLTISHQLWNSITERERLAWIEFAEAQHHLSGP